MKKFKLTLLLICLLQASACSTFYGGSTNSEGEQSISASPTEVYFEGEEGTVTQYTISFKNRSNTSYLLDNIAFVDNDCGAFSIYNIEDNDGNELYEAGDNLNLTIAADTTIYIQIEFSPISCEQTEFIATLILYYTEDGVDKSETINLSATVVPGLVEETVECDIDDSIEYYDEVGDPTPPRDLPALASGKYYYIKVNKMSAYLQTTEGYTSYAKMVGTQIDLDNIPEEKYFEPIFIPFTSDDDANVVLNSWDECLDFRLPTDPTDPFFSGADLYLISNSTIEGTVLREDTTDDNVDDLGQLDVPNFSFYLKGFINNIESLIQDSTGYFGISASGQLTTGYTESNTFLQNLTELTDDDGETFLNISEDGDDSKMFGKNIRHGTLTLVGILEFSDEDALMQSLAFEALIDTEAYLFVQLEAQIVEVREDETE
jgi:hypothetical protein